MPARETTVEKYLVDKAAGAGGQCPKLTKMVGIPDRVLILPIDPAFGFCWVAYIETKRPKGGRVSEAQKYWADLLRGCGFLHYIAYTKAQIDDVFRLYDAARAEAVAERNRRLGAERGGA